MFPVGTIVKGPFPATVKGFNVWAHYLVVLQSDHRGTVAMFITSLKDANGGSTGGNCAFDSEELSAGGLNACRFDPTRIALFKPADARNLRATGGKLFNRMVSRLVDAASKAKANVVTYCAALPTVDSVSSSRRAA